MFRTRGKGAAGAAVVATVCGLWASTGRAATSFGTVGTYGPGTNAVDSVADATAGGSPVTAGDAYNGFRAAVASAFTAGNGGVIDFEGPAGNDFTTAFTTTYAAGAKSLAVTAAPGFRIASGPSTSTQISGNSAISGATSGSADVAAYGFTFGPVTGGSPGEAVTRVGFTLLSRTGYPTNPTPFTVTATFSGGGTTVLTSDITSGNGTDDTFYGFTAPAGQSITGIAISSNQTSRPTFADDLGYITSVVPEPASLGLLFPGALLLAGRRRARRA